MPLPGWRPLPKDHPSYEAKARRYLSPSGDVVSRRQYDNERLESSGWDSKADFDNRFTARKNRGYKRWIDAAERNLDIPHKQLAKVDSEFNQAYLRMRDDGFNQSPDGTMAEFLVFIGLRRPDQDSPVGDGDTGYS